MAAARESLAFKLAQQSNIQILQHYTKMLLTYQQILADLQTQINQTAEFSSAFPLLLSIPGVGKLTAATIIGEIGAVSRFSNVKKLVAYSGLDPSVYQSGRFKATNNKISKRGSPYLRKALYQATKAATRKYKGKPNNKTLYDYYTKKVAEGKHTKVACIATCNKLLRIIYGIWKNK
jgi:transposase